MAYHPKLKRPKNTDARPREWLTEDEVKALVKAAKSSRYGKRDEMLLLLMFKHGLRMNEAASLQWSHIDLNNRQITILRSKDGDKETYPLDPTAYKKLKQWKRESAYIFQSQRGSKLSPASIQKIVNQAAERANIGFSVHPHMIRHACGFALATNGSTAHFIQWWLGHKRLESTRWYINKAANRGKEPVWSF
jgi:integrase